MRRSKLTVILIGCTAFAISVWPSSLFANDDLAEVAQFVNRYCISCHGLESQEADRRFDSLNVEAVAEDQEEIWHEILDRLNLADMPPEDAERQPSDEERIEIADKLTGILSSAQDRHREQQTSYRRLNRDEYDRAIRDVLGLENMLQDPTANFPPDESADHFRNVGDALVMSDILLTRYLEASDEYLREARHRAAVQAKVRTWSFEAPFCRNMPNPDGQDRPGEFQHIRENATDNFGYLWLQRLRQGVPVSGRYRIRVTAAAINRDYPYKEEIIRVPREDPLRMSIVAGDVRAGDMATNNSTDRVLAAFDVPDNTPHTFEATVWLDQHYQPRFGFPNGPVRIKYMRHRLLHEHRDSFPRFIEDHVHVFHSMHPDYDPTSAPELQKAFLDEQERKKAAGLAYDVFGVAHRMHTDAAWIQFYKEYQGPRIRVFDVELEGPLPPSDGDSEVSHHFFPSSDVSDDEARRLLTEFAARAYRRPVEEAELKPILNLYDHQRAASASTLDALQIGYQSILCSPAFLYHRTSTGPLDDFELASRLSFFLWAMPPDEQLRQLAAEGMLSDPDVLKQQANRLLDDPRSDNLVATFLNSCLQLSKLGKMLPDRVEHPAYYNEQLETAMRRETHEYIADALRRDAEISVLIDSDYSFINSSLARLYEIPGVEGHEFRRIKLEDRRRGGLLGHASVLTATANGIDTSPVIRGIWVLESLLGTPPSPPPADVEPLEPDIRGATTVRDRLAKHRHVATCNNCHRRIDPPGFALESFDELGKYRTHYDVPGRRRQKGPQIDSTGQLSSGESFTDIVGFKALLMEQVDLVTKNVATKLLVLATGRLDDPTDRADILHLMQGIADGQGKDIGKDIGLRTLVHKVIQSDAFAR